MKVDEVLEYLYSRMEVDTEHFTNLRDFMPTLMPKDIDNFVENTAENERETTTEASRDRDEEPEFDEQPVDCQMPVNEEPPPESAVATLPLSESDPPDEYKTEAEIEPPPPEQIPTAAEFEEPEHYGIEASIDEYPVGSESKIGEDVGEYPVGSESRLQVQEVDPPDEYQVYGLDIQPPEEFHVPEVEVEQIIGEPVVSQLFEDGISLQDEITQTVSMLESEMQSGVEEVLSMLNQSTPSDMEVSQFMRNRT